MILDSSVEALPKHDDTFAVAVARSRIKYPDYSLTTSTWSSSTWPVKRSIATCTQ